jgi:hypothetical protein
LLCIGQIKPKSNQLTFHKTKLGWIVSGRVINKHKSQLSCVVLNNDLRIQLEKFWELEEVSENAIYTKEENLCEQLFKNTTVQDENNRFIVNLPVRENIDKLGESRSVAMKRLIAIKRKLSKQLSLKNQFMNQYESLGHMSKVMSETKQVASPASY